MVKKRLRVGFNALFQRAPHERFQQQPEDVGLAWWDFWPGAVPALFPVMNFFALVYFHSGGLTPPHTSAGTRIKVLLPELSAVDGQNI